MELQSKLISNENMGHYNVQIMLHSSCKSWKSHATFNIHFNSYNRWLHSITMVLINMALIWWKKIKFKYGKKSYSSFSSCTEKENVFYNYTRTNAALFSRSLLLFVRFTFALSAFFLLFFMLFSFYFIDLIVIRAYISIE